MAYTCPTCGDVDKGHQVTSCWRCQPKKYKKEKGGK